MQEGTSSSSPFEHSSVSTKGSRWPSLTVAEPSSDSREHARMRLYCLEQFRRTCGDWSKEFGVTPEELKVAMKAAGNQTDKVEAHLKGRKPAAA